MSLRVDPDENEVRALAQVMNWRGKRVLEIGCGDGRLTMRLARLGARVWAIDPDEALVRQARRSMPKRWKTRVEFHRGHGENLQQPNESFDVSIFAWAL